MVRYPRMIVMFPGIVVVVRSEREYRRMRRHDLIGVCAYMFGIVIAGGVVMAAWWL